MKVHPMIANPSTIKPGKWNESESSLNEFAFSAIALDEMKKMMKNIVINSVCERRCNPPQTCGYMFSEFRKYTLLKNLGFPKKYNNRSLKFPDSPLFFLNVVSPIL